MAYIGNFLITKLSGDITSSATTMMVTSGDGVKFGAEMIRLYGTELFPYYLVIHSANYQQATLDPNREIVKVTGRDEDTFTIVRGQRGTTASAHSVNDIVQLSIQADDVIVPLNGLINPDFISPLYVSPLSFSVDGDVTSWLRPGRGVVISFATSGIKRCVATSLSFSSSTNKTTINTIGDSLVNETITSVLLSSSDLEPLANKKYLGSQLDLTCKLYLPLDEGLGTTTKDLSGWSNHGTLVNGPTWTTGRVGNCLSFDGSDDYVDVNDFQLGGEITVEGWVYPTAHQSHQRLLDFGNGEHADNIVMAASQKTTVQPLLDVYVGSTHYRASSSDPITLNSWHHLVGVVGGGRVKLYVDNVLKADVAGPSGLNNLIRTNNYIGRSNWSRDAFFKGLIDEIRIYNRALSATEIQDHYLNP